MTLVGGRLFLLVVGIIVKEPTVSHTASAGSEASGQSESSAKSESSSESEESANSKESEESEQSEQSAKSEESETSAVYTPPVVVPAPFQAPIETKTTEVTETPETVVTEIAPPKTVDPVITAQLDDVLPVVQEPIEEVRQPTTVVVKEKERLFFDSCRDRDTG